MFYKITENTNKLTNKLSSCAKSTHTWTKQTTLGHLLKRYAENKILLPLEFPKFSTLKGTLLMKLYKSAIASIVLVFSTQVHSALEPRLGGLAVYDTDANLTWLSDANHSMTTGYSWNGAMSWHDAIIWADSLNIYGVTGWRLPNTIQPDPDCDGQGYSYEFSIPISQGYNCTGSEMGNLFYNVLGGIPGSSIINSANPNLLLFKNIINGLGTSHRSSTEYAPNTERAWLFNFNTGRQAESFKYVPSVLAWAVHDGDVSAPDPAADLSVAATTTPGPVKKGSKLYYQIVVKNEGNGNTAADSVLLESVFSSNVRLVSASSSQGSCVEFSPKDTEVRCNLGSIALYTNAIITLTAKAMDIGDFTNSIRVETTTYESNLINNSTTINTVVYK